MPSASASPVPKVRAWLARSVSVRQTSQLPTNAIPATLAITAWIMTRNACPTCASQEQGKCAIAAGLRACGLSSTSALTAMLATTEDPSLTTSASLTTALKALAPLARSVHRRRTGTDMGSARSAMVATSSSTQTATLSSATLVTTIPAKSASRRMSELRITSAPAVTMVTLSLPRRHANLGRATKVKVHYARNVRTFRTAQEMVNARSATLVTDLPMTRPASLSHVRRGRRVARPAMQMKAVARSACQGTSSAKIRCVSLLNAQLGFRRQNARSAYPSRIDPVSSRARHVIQATISRQLRSMEPMRAMSQRQSTLV
mmetsp:Transcript_37038/g.67083  ORF Transcript_37038/g.67083 Transcript_37038/m.67083 type:complete len:317 (-) Transcript_37038:2614-3564(-)